MKLSWPKGKPIRFDSDISKADDISNIPFVIDPVAIVGVFEEHRGLLCRYRVYAVNKNNEEVFGYVREALSDISEFGTEETDLPILTKFCSDTFINVEIDFQEKMRLPYNIFGRTRPNFDKMGESLLEQLVDLGHY
ncbi:hypothetical protein [Mucilaginibacter sp. OK098]|uniref:hypothetical protein n=1 Tax=Mucilaginibacter sp. OK098 TaxID=1855297 RepID=UPI00091CB0A2|nr:hypothetical protein [Mucilaginibacter sp. OK098]SHN13706.1 hypothetical protein SAMN05216524_105539 [Mucilaginibacter sp. OK098]